MNIRIKWGITVLLTVALVLAVAYFNQNAALTASQASMLTGQLSDSSFQQSQQMSTSYQINISVLMYVLLLLLVWGRQLYNIGRNIVAAIFEA